MDHLPAAAPIIRLIEELSKLPGVGPKSAQRLAYHIIRASREDADSLSLAITTVKDKVVLCSICQNLTDINPCIICTDTQRDHAILCVVEQPADILSLEKTRKYRGLYHVLHGAISPLNGVGPRDLKIKELLERLQGKDQSPPIAEGRNGLVTELLLATNPSLEGEATAMYIYRQCLQSQVAARITRLARGLPAGGDLEYADEVTLARSLEGRQDMS